jgi:lipoyl-dependent peroxiredoxin
VSGRVVRTEHCVAETPGTRQPDVIHLCFAKTCGSLQKLSGNAFFLFNFSKEFTMTAINPLDKVLYTGKTHTIGGRNGESRSSDGRLDIKLSPPGSAGLGTNPEQLFAAGWSACFIGAMGRAAGTQKVTLPANLAVDAEVDLGTAGDAFFLQARLNVSLPGLDSTTARAIVDAAHQLCPYSKATRGNIDVEINLV